MAPITLWHGGAVRHGGLTVTVNLCSIGNLNVITMMMLPHHVTQSTATGSMRANARPLQAHFDNGGFASPTIMSTSVHSFRRSQATGHKDSTSDLHPNYDCHATPASAAAAAPAPPRADGLSTEFHTELRSTRTELNATTEVKFSYIMMDANFANLTALLQSLLAPAAAHLPAPASSPSPMILPRAHRDLHLHLRPSPHKIPCPCSNLWLLVVRLRPPWCPLPPCHSAPTLPSLPHAHLPLPHHWQRPARRSPHSLPRRSLLLLRTLLPSRALLPLVVLLTHPATPTLLLFFASPDQRTCMCSLKPRKQ